MPHAATAPSLIRRVPLVRRVVASWRGLTGGAGVPDTDRATLVACSGGADSAALAIALAGTPARVVIAHIVHDLRPEDEALGDRDSTATLAERLGVGFVERRIEPSLAGGNAEGRAREMRYAALGQLAVEAGTPFVATAHHADDQLETLLMRLVRGAGPRGMGGIAPRRPLGGVTLVRPMLGLDRAASEAICMLADWRWREDRTNLDVSRTRAALRHEVIPALKRIAPGAAERAAATGDACREAAEAISMIAARAGSLSRVDTSEAIMPGGAIAWDRRRLRRLPPAVLGELLRTSAIGLTGGGADRLPRRTIGRIVRAIREQSGRPRAFALRGLRLELDRTSVRMERDHGRTAD